MWAKVKLSEKASKLLESEDPYKDIQKEENYPCVTEIFRACAHDRDLVYEKQKLVALIVKIIKPQDLQEAIAGKAQLICQTLKDRGIFTVIHEDQPKSAFKLHPNVREIGLASLNERENSKEIFSSFFDSVHKREKDQSKAVQIIDKYRNAIIKYLCTGAIDVPRDTLEELLKFVKDTLELATLLDVKGFSETLQNILKDQQIDLIRKYLREYLNTLNKSAELNKYAECCLKLASDFDLPLLRYAASFYAKKPINDRNERSEEVVELFNILVRNPYRIFNKLPPIPKNEELISHLFCRLTFNDITQIKNKQQIHLWLAQSGCAKAINKQPEHIKLICQGAENFFLLNKKLLALTIPHFFTQHEQENDTVNINYSIRSIALLYDYILSKKIDMKNLLTIDEDLKLVAELLDLAHNWQIEGLKQSIEKYLIRYELSDQTAEKYLKLAETYDLEALNYVKKYYINAEDSTLKDIKNPKTRATVVRLFSTLTSKQNCIKWHELLVGHLLDLLTYEDILTLKFVKKLPFWLKSEGIVEIQQGWVETDEKKKVTERFKKALALASPELCKLFWDKGWTSTDSYSDNATKTVFHHLIEKPVDVNNFISLKENLSEKDFSKTIMDIIFLAEAWQLHDLQKQVETYLTEHEIDETNAGQFLDFQFGFGMKKVIKRAESEVLLMKMQADYNK